VVVIVTDFIINNLELAGVLGAVLSVLGIWLYRIHWLLIQPALTLRWADERKKLLILHIEITNRSKLLVVLSIIKLQVFERNLPQPGEHISEFVAFAKQDMNCMAPPIALSEWHDPVVIMGPFNVEPGETISVERAYVCKEDLPIVHCALQLRAEVNWFRRCVSGIRKTHEQWTTIAVATR
jgi:hypothetical protein